MTTGTATSQKFATLDKGKIVTLCDGYPPQELRECQIALTTEEYWFLKSIDGQVENAARLVKAIKAKIKANGS